MTPHALAKARDIVRVLAGTVNNLRQDNSINGEAKKTLDLTAKFLLDQITAALDASRKDYEEVLADHRRLVRKLDVLMNGENAAKQASLCDIVGSFERWLETHDKSARAEEREACASSLDEAVQYYTHEADSALKHNSDEIYYESNGAARAIRQLATEIRARGGGGVMGEMADDLVAGRTCSWCGVYFTQEHSYPVVCKGCWKDATTSERQDVEKAIYPEL